MGKLKHPGNLADLTREALDDWHAKVREAARELSGKSELSDDDMAYSRELIGWAGEITADYERRTTEADTAGVRADLAALGNPDPDEGNDGEGDDGEGDDPAPAADAGPDEAVMSSVRGILTAVEERIRAEHAPAPAGAGPDSGDHGAPSVSDLAAAGAGGDLPEGQHTGPVMVAAADYSGYNNGQPLDGRRGLAAAFKERMSNYVSAGGHGAGPVLPTPEGFGAATVMSETPGGGLAPTARTVRVSGGHQRHRVARIARDERGDFGADPEENRSIALAAADDWTRQLRAGRTAAIGGAPRDALIAAWCATGESWYGLCDQWSLDGLLPLPTRNVPRGEVRFAEGYDFATIYDEVGDNTATSEQLANGVTKTCIEAPCLEAETTGLNADWLCVTANLLQRRAWPESIESFLSAALAVKAHKTNARIIAAIVAGSTDAGTITAGGDEDAFTSFLSGVELAITDMAYRAYMSLSGEYEVIAPAWVLPQLRHAVMRRRGLEDPVKADAWMQAQLAKINATVHFVYGWQDAHVTTPATGLPGGDTPLTELPTEVQFAVYPAGTWVQGVNPVIELDTIYDSVGLESNSYTALFVEDGWAALKLCPYSRVYTVSVDPYGCGCASGSATS